MINFFRTWLPGIIDYCEMIADEKAFRKAWIHADLTNTSAYYPGELFEQIFGDLDSEMMRKEMNQKIMNVELIDAINSFLDILSELETWLNKNLDITGWSKGGPNPIVAKEIFSSPLWGTLKRAAGKVVELSVVR